MQDRKRQDRKNGEHGHMHQAKQENVLIKKIKRKGAKTRSRKESRGEEI